MANYTHALNYEFHRLCIPALAVATTKPGRVWISARGFKLRIPAYRALMVIGNLPEASTNQQKENAMTNILSMAD